jgi:ABC-2 type transport system permease protein
MWEKAKVIYIIWYRDVLRYWRNKVRVVSGLAFPIIWLVFFGTGMSSSLQIIGGEGIDYILFVFPGILAMNLIFSSIFSSISIVTDREFGFLREILVAPISRGAIAVGKTLGGATTAFLQALLILILAPIVGITLNFKMVLFLIPAMFLISFALTAFGVLIASRLKSSESASLVFQFVVMPMYFLSGALFPLSNLPHWLYVFVRINPVTYAVDILRQIVFLNSGIEQSVVQSLGADFLGKPLTIDLDFFIVLFFALIMIFLSVQSFRQTE